VAAGEEMGYQNRDGNGEFQTGFMIPQVASLIKVCSVEFLAVRIMEFLTVCTVDF
jgi:hypothetical protein